MVTESLNKSKVASGAIQFQIGSDGLIQVVIPVADAKADEAVPLIEELYTTALTNYNKSVNMNPRDVAQCLRSVAEAIERGQMKLTEDKYNGTGKRNRR